MEAKDWLAPAATLAGFFIVNFVAESYKRFKSGSVMAAGIIGELRGYEMAWPILIGYMNVIIAAHTPDDAEKFDAKFRGEFEAPKDRVFEANVANLGLLGPELAAKVAELYGRFLGFRTAFRNLHNYYEEMSVVESREQARFIRKWLEEIKLLYDEIVPLLDARAKADWLLTKLATYSAP